MTIKILSNSTINKIAAGEVIERPASVVKELVENSIDAGSTQIDIILECAGKNLIVIKDNGKGMSKDELELAIQRHATSKLDEDDLLNINSFGFRGEALPSIGAISKFKITSQKSGSENAYTLSIIGGTIEPTKVANGNVGTIIEVRDLFFATPARLKFLRTDRTELTAITNCVKKIALAHPEISFTLTHDERELLKVRKQSGPDSIKNRISEIVGEQFIENATEISFERDGVAIYGYTSLPTYNKASADEQHLFINNRPVKDKILNIALKVAYQDYLARDRQPVSVIFLSVNPEQVDVNVHPAKSEVRFHDPNMIRGMVISSIKDALNNSSNRVSTTPAATAINYMRSTQTHSGFRENSTNQGRFSIPSSRQTNSSPPARTDYAIAQAPQSSQPLVNSAPQSIVEQQSSNELQETTDFPLGAAKAQLHSTYIISQSSDSIIITDQHAAHERIGYEKIKEQIDKNGLIKQRLLIPEIVELSDESKAEILNENKTALAKLGLTIEKFGEKSIIVSEIPSLVGDINVTSLISDLADHFTSLGENIALTELIEHITETYACHYAIRAGRKLNANEMNELLRQMESTPFSGQCNHGRQTYVELKLKDIEKLFGRK
ncbi:MAG: DNA mismatch repair endonuclease MutL [Pseudomonadota bacterium]